MAESGKTNQPAPGIPEVNNGNNRGRSSSRKRQLSTSDEQMNPPASRPRSQSVNRQSSGDSDPITFKTQGQTYNMNKLVEDVIVKQDVLKSVVPIIVQNVKSDMMSEFKTVIKTAVTEAIAEAVKPLHEMIRNQELKISNLQVENQSLKKHCESCIEQIENRYDKFRNLANAHSKLLSENGELKDEISSLNAKIEDLEQYGRRTSLRFHNVPLTTADLQHTDRIIVTIVNEKLHLLPPLTENDINRSHIIGSITNGKGQLICRFRNWKIKNSVYMAKKILYRNPDNMFITEDLTKHRQSIIKELSIQKKARKLHSFWTFDGRIFVRKTEAASKSLVKSVDDVHELVRG